MSSQLTAKSTCDFVDGVATPCGRARFQAQRYCALHANLRDDAYPVNLQLPAFEGAFDALLKSKDGNWRGILFPKAFRLPSDIDFPVDARWTQFTDLDLDKVVFKAPIDFSNATFSGSLVFRSAKFEQSVSFERCRFDCIVDFLNVECQTASFHRAEFSQRAVIRANFSGLCNFTESVFMDGATFSGWRNLTLSIGGVSASASVGGVGVTTGTPTAWQRIAQYIAQVRSWVRRWWRDVRKRVRSAHERLSTVFHQIRRRFVSQDKSTTIFAMFEAEGHMENVVFLKPDQTAFTAVDLSKVFFRGTNLRGVRFLGVTWWQPTLRRNGVRDEVLVAESRDGPFRHQELPVLQETCRNARVAMEDNKNFGVASDFYVGEMEAIRQALPLLRRHFVSVPAVYRFVSNYGTSVGTTVRILVYLLLLHYGLSLLIAIAPDTSRLAVLGVPTALRSLRVLILQSPEVSWGTINLS